VRVQRRQRAGRPAELHGQPADHLGEPRPGPVQPGAPPRRDQPERRRQRLLPERARDHRRVPVPARQPGRRVGGPAQVVEHDLRRPADEQHCGGVHHVLAGGAGVHRRTRLARRTAQHPHQRDHRVAALDRGPPERRGVDPQRRGGRLDPVRVLRGHDPVLGRGPRQRHLDRDERRHPRGVVQPGGHPVGPEQRVEERARHDAEPTAPRISATLPARVCDVTGPSAAAQLAMASNVPGS
jgi:hypothetical protein